LWRPSRRASAAAAQDAPASVSVQPAQTTQSATMDDSPAGSQDSRTAGVFLLQLCGTLFSYCVVRHGLLVLCELSSLHQATFLISMLP